MSLFLHLIELHLVSTGAERPDADVYLIAEHTEPRFWWVIAGVPELRRHGKVAVASDEDTLPPRAYQFPGMAVVVGVYRELVIIPLEGDPMRLALMGLFSDVVRLDARTMAIVHEAGVKKVDINGRIVASWDTDLLETWRIVDGAFVYTEFRGVEKKFSLV